MRAERAAGRIRDGLRASIRWARVRSGRWWWRAQQDGRTWMNRALPEFDGRVRELRDFGMLATSAPQAQAQSDWWSAQRQELALLMAPADPREFLTWQPVYKTMVIGTTSRAFVELRALRSEPGWHDRWAPSLREDPVGLPAPFAPFPRSS